MINKCSNERVLVQKTKQNKNLFFLINLQQVIFSSPTGWQIPRNTKTSLCLFNTVYMCVHIKSITAAQSFFLDLGCAPHPLKLYKQNKLLCTSHPCNEDTCGCAFPIALYRAEGTRLTDQRLPKQTRGVYDLISLCLSIYIYYIYIYIFTYVSLKTILWHFALSGGS